MDVDKLDINELEKAPYGVNSLKSNVDKMMCISWSLFLLIKKKLSDVVNKNVLKNQSTKKIKRFRKKKEDVENKMSDVSGSFTNTAFNTKNWEVEKVFLMPAD